VNIFLSPSESKIIAGEHLPFNKNNFYFKDLWQTRNKIVSCYQDFISKSNIDKLSAFFAIKDKSKIARYQIPVTSTATELAIKKYSGVSFSAISYDTLTKKSQEYINKNVLIFSNLYGLLKADDKIADYRYKAGATLSNMNTNKLYKEKIKSILDDYLGDEIVDLRALYHQSFYPIKKKYTTFVFSKNDKTIGHWSKFYRGKIVRLLSLLQLKSCKELEKITYPDMEITNIQNKQNKTIISLNIL
jgi:uncharacterized protein